MISKHLMIAIYWYGPYRDLNEARRAARDDYEHGLYLAIGKCRRERRLAMQYVGIGGSIHTRLNDRHHKLSLITRERQIWLGEIATAEPSGKRMKVTRTTLDYAEWLHARFLGLPLNDKKTKEPPNRGVTVLNRWFSADDYDATKRRPHSDWPDLIDFPGYQLPARAVWFGRRQRTFTAPHYLPPDS
ncbi:hypothetical protein NF701_08360 [Sphingomonadaceae bacterium OTU29THOMA1]|nr:hypothetical protein NF701_08360 [Sphingomonadaceae bacterium OTU29THOMA1]